MTKLKKKNLVEPHYSSSWVKYLIFIYHIFGFSSPKKYNLASFIQFNREKFIYDFPIWCKQNRLIYGSSLVNYNLDFELFGLLHSVK